MRSPGRQRILPFAVLCAASLLVAPALAAESEYPAIESNGYVVDGFDATVIGSSRIIGLGGAYAAVAEGIAGFAHNPAALARRYPYSTDWWDYDLAIDWLVTGVGTDMDATNTGLAHSEGADVRFVVLGGSLQFGRLGIGVHLRGRTHRLALSETIEDSTGVVTGYDFGLGEVMLGAGYEIIPGRVLVGGGIGGSYLNINPVRGTKADGSPLVSFKSNIWSVGVLWMPGDRSWSFGGAASSGGEMGRDIGDAQVVAGRYLPQSVQRPVQVTFGAAFRHDFGDPKHDRRYLRWSGDVVGYSKAPDAVSLDGFLAQRAQPSGQEGSLAIRSGLESEVIHDRLVLRGGTYYEPARVPGRDGRTHLTGGFELRLFELVWMWKLSSALDVSSNYSNWSLGLGFWH